MILEIITENTTVRHEVTQVLIPTILGNLSIYPGHTPLVCVLKAGNFKWKTHTEEKEMPVISGYTDISEAYWRVILTELE